jgi:hypothetical protein
MGRQSTYHLTDEEQQDYIDDAMHAHRHGYFEWHKDIRTMIVGDGVGRYVPEDELVDASLDALSAMPSLLK